MSEIHPLALHPYPVPDAVLALLKRAKGELDVEYQVVPVPAVPGGPTRVLAFMAPPPFLCECAIVVDPTNYEAIREGMKLVLQGDADDSRLFTSLDYLRALMGPDVREISDEELRREQFPLLM